MGWESSDVLRLDLEPLLQGQMRTGKFKSAYISLIIGPTGLGCETNLSEIIGWDDVVRFDLAPLLQGQTRAVKLKTAYNMLIIGPRCLQCESTLRCLQCEPTYGKSWAGNLLMWTDLTLVRSFKVKRWFTSFGELSFRWIQICIASPMCRSSSFWRQVNKVYLVYKKHKYIFYN